LVSEEDESEDEDDEDPESPSDEPLVAPVFFLP
jgi:hypothetical protein